MCDRDGRVLLYNDAALELWGHVPDPEKDLWCGTQPIFNIDGSELPIDQCPTAITMRFGVPIRGGEFILQRPDGSRRWVLAHPSILHDGAGNNIGAINMLIDITHRKQIEREMRDAKEFMHASLDALTSHIAVLDEHGVILAVNDAWRRFADDNQYSGHDYGVGSSYLDECESSTSDCGEQKIAAQGIRDVLSGKRRSFEMEYPCHSPTEQRWFMMRVTRFATPGPVRLVVSHENVTERRIAVDAMREADRRKDEFLATLAHELRNPLAPICTALNIIKQPAISERTRCESIAMMQRQVNQMVRLVDDLLDVARITTGKMALRVAPVDLTEALRSAIESSRPLIDEMGHRLVVNLPATPMPMEADLTRLAQIFLNLLNNAAKYSDRGGQITLGARVEGHDAIVSVKDQGIGVRADMLPRLFEMFVQSDRALTRARGGLGVGLSLVKRLVELHGGRVHAISEGPGKGSEFIVRLPMARQSQHVPPMEKSRNAENSRASRVLIVDDNVDAAESLSLFLQLSGHVTAVGHSGAEALEKAQEFKPEVILLDIGLPDQTGYDVCRQLRKTTIGKNAVIAALTGWGQDDDKRLSREAGFDHHLVKPVEPDSLNAWISQLPVGSRQQSTY